jgi:hypothetical protein
MARHSHRNAGKEREGDSKRRWQDATGACRAELLDDHIRDHVTLSTYRDASLLNMGFNM